MFFTTPRWAACCFIALAMLSTITTAFQVTPDSPCASLCLEPVKGSSAPDPSMPSMHPDDILCSNRDFASEKGRRFKGCMNCLQNSTYTQGTQSDQTWFMYNLQYAFTHCVFGYPNGSVGIGPYPCMTSEACGPLKTTVSKTLANNTGNDPYAYCSYKGRSTLGDTFGKCLDCLRPDTQHGYVANYFVALEAGCEQRPGVHGRLALNDTLFANRTISIIDPNKPKKSPKAGLSSGALIAVIVISVLLGLGLVCGAVFLFLRRRRHNNRYNKSALEYAANNNHKQDSSMDFSCAARVNPFSPGPPNNNNNNTGRDGAACGGSTAADVPLPGYATPADEKASLAAAAADKKQQQQPSGVDALRSHPPAGPVRNFSHKQHPSNGDEATALEDLARPDKVVTGSSSSSATPYSADCYVTPSSATSATPLFAAGQTSAFSRVSPPPSRSALAKQPSWEDTRVQGRGGLLRSKGSKTDVHAPVAARQFQTTFPPPPKR